MADQNPPPPPPPFNPYKHKHHFVRHVVTSIVLVIVSFAAGFYFAGRSTLPPADTEVVLQEECEEPIAEEKGSYEEGYESGIDFSREQLTKIGLLQADRNIEINRLRARVKSVKGQEILVEFEAFDLDILAEGMDTRTVIVPDTVVLEKRTRKPVEQYRSEIQKYEKVLLAFEERSESDPDAGLEGPEVPKAYTIEELKVSDMKEGDELVISAEVDIRTNETFEAIKIEFNSRSEGRPGLSEDLDDDSGGEIEIFEAVVVDSADEDE